MLHIKLSVALVTSSLPPNGTVFAVVNLDDEATAYEYEMVRFR
jgi:hypothetical protein